MLSRKCIDDTSEIGLSPFTPQVNDWIWSTAAHVIRDEQAQFQTEKKTSFFKPSYRKRITFNWLNNDFEGANWNGRQPSGH